MSFGIQGVTSVSSALNLLSAPTAAAGAQAPPDPFGDPNGPFANLNLTSDQKTKIAQIVSSAKSQGLSFSQVNSQINSVLTPSQQQTLQSDLQQVKSHHGGHHHHHGGSGNSGSSPSLLSQLDLSSDQQNQISQLVQGGQSNGTSSGTLLSQIGNVLSNSQQTQLADLLSTSTYTPSGSGTTNTQPFLVNTAA